MAESESESTASEQIIESDDGVEAKARLYCRNCAKIVKRLDSKLKLEANAKWKDSNGIYIVESLILDLLRDLRGCKIISKGVPKLYTNN